MEEKKKKKKRERERERDPDERRKSKERKGSKGKGEEEERVYLSPHGLISFIHSFTLSLSLTHTQPERRDRRSMHTQIFIVCFVFFIAALSQSVSQPVRFFLSSVDRKQT